MSDTRQRFAGLDLARFIAFCGMVIVNFKIVMVAEGSAVDLWGALSGALEGRAAASFVVLAGLGLGLAAASQADLGKFRAVTAKRALFLLLIGLLNSLIFSADILHYYAFYFFVGVFCLGFSSRLLWLAIFAANIVFMLMLLLLNYDQNWDWTTLTYAGFWTPEGFVLNLFFNGWHPLFPWISFLLYGLWLSKLPLAQVGTQRRMLFAGMAGLVVLQLLSAGLVKLSGDNELALLFGTSPIPPVPLYILTGISAATALIGACLLIANCDRAKNITAWLAPAGKQSLTLYSAHIFVGMGVLESLDMLENQSAGAALLAAIGFCLLSVLYALVWRLKFRRGPIEVLMRRLAG